MDAVGPGDESIQAGGGRCDGGLYLQLNGGYIGSRGHGQNFLQQHEGFESGSERYPLGEGRRNSPQGYCYRAVNYYGSGLNDADQGSGADMIIQRNDQHDNSYDCVEEQQSGRSLGFRTNKLEFHQEAIAKDRMFC